MKSVHEVCKLVNVSRKRLYYYDHIGLLPPSVRVGSQKAKMYDAEALERLKNILELQKAGLRISEIKDMLDQDERKQKQILHQAALRLYQERNLLTEQIRNLEEILHRL